MPEWINIFLLSLAAGASIPLGTALGFINKIQPQWLKEELRHFILSFGGGALLAAVSLVLIPEGLQNLSLPLAVTSFLTGGVFFMLLDRSIEKRGGSVANMIAMMTDFIPEALALGASFAHNKATAILMAVLIAIQNIPESFNAYREVTEHNDVSKSKWITLFCLLALVGPIAALSGHFFLQTEPLIKSTIMMFSASGILYLIFQDVAPQSKLEKSWAPSLGAVLGFLVGLIGHMLTQ